MKENKILLVSGASSDIGTALIKRIGNNYETVAAHYCHSKEKLVTLGNELSCKLVPIQADFTDVDSGEDFVRKVTGQGLIPDHFVHLAAPPLNNIKFSKTSWEDFEREITVSFRSAVLLSQAFLPKMAKQKYGKIIFMLSFNVVNQPPIKFAVPYTSAKYALLGLMRGMSAEYAEKGITINGVSPSMIETKFLSNVPDLIVEKNAAESPLKRNLTVEDVLPTIEFLLSKGADCVTGQNVSVTGGN